MQIQFQFSLDDYLAAQYLHATRSPWPQFTYALTHYIYPILGLFFLILSIPLMRSNIADHSGLTVIICGIILVSCPIYLHIRLKRSYKRTVSDNGECKATFDEVRIKIKGQYSSAEMDWRAIKSFRENKKVFLLYLAPGKFLVIPKRVCTEEQIGELRTIFLQKIHQDIQ
jgi:hypothetical protein